MRNEKSATRSLMMLLFIASVVLNVCFIAGCRSLHDAVYGKPCKYAPVPPVHDIDKAVLVGIAESLNIKTEGKNVSDLSSDIHYKLDRDTAVPIAFDAAAFDKMAKDLRVEEKDAMREYQRFITNLQGKRVIVIEQDAE